MTAYAIAHLQHLRFGPAIAEYLQAIDGSLAPYGGRFPVHGAQAEVLEGPWQRDMVVIGFASWEHTRACYAFPAYQAILPLRTGNSRGQMVLADGAKDGHRAVDLLSRIGLDSGAAPGPQPVRHAI